MPSLNPETATAVTCSRILAVLFIHGPQSWVDLCLRLKVEITKDSPAWEPLEHLFELGLVRSALMVGSSVAVETKYKAIGWTRTKPIWREHGFHLPDSAAS